MPERTGSIAGIVLAAGMSTRMGQNKLFLELDDETLVRRVVGQVSKAGGIPYVPVFSREYERGVNSSLRAGVAAVSGTSAHAAVVVLADMPFVTTAMIMTLVAKYRQSAAPLVISNYDGVNAPPMLYDRSLFPELVASDGEGCGKHVVNQHRHEAESASWPRSAHRSRRAGRLRARQSVDGRTALTCALESYSGPSCLRSSPSLKLYLMLR